MTHSDAAQMPLVAGTALVSLYVAFKYFDPSMINLVLKGYFLLAGLVACSSALTGFTRNFVSHKKPLFTIPRIPYVMPSTPCSAADVTAFFFSSIIITWYGLTQHWFANNIIGICFCIQGLSLINIGNYGVGALLLSGLFIYDIIMVFYSGLATGGESIMVAVATKVDGPIKLIFPLAAGTVTPSGRSHSLLGLGDIIVPGIFLAHLLRYDLNRHIQKESKKNENSSSGSSTPRTPASSSTNATEPFDGLALGPHFSLISSNFPAPFFNCTLFFYMIGLAVTTVVMYTFNAAQPALLYLVPAVLGASFLQAVFRGEVSSLLSYQADDDLVTGDTKVETKSDGNESPMQVDDTPTVTPLAASTQDNAWNNANKSRSSPSSIRKR